MPTPSPTTMPSGLAPHTEDVSAIAPTPRQDIDAMLNDLAQNKDMWATLEPAEYIEILDEMMRDVNAVAEEWVQACVDAKGIEGNNTTAVGEEWATFSFVPRIIRLLRQSIQDIDQHDAPQLPKPLRVNAHQHVTADVFPASTLDKFSQQGISAEVWMRAGDSVEDTLNAQASAYKTDAPAGRVSLVLGAGNASALVPADFLHKLFVERAVVVLKPNPVNVYLGPIITRGFRSLVERGYLQVVYGGVSEGQYLCNHPLVDEVHLTGSDKTFAAIVFGPGDDGQRNKQAHTPVLEKPVTAELGNITPVIVVPGPWSAQDVERQGRKLAPWLTFNAGFNCVTPRLIIQQQQWAHRDGLNAAIRRGLADTETRTAFYPGAAARHAAFMEAHPNAWQEGDPKAGELPWTYVVDVDAATPYEIAFQSESFCGLMAETALNVDGIAEYLAEAVRFANDTLWGTLAAVLVVHPDSLKDPGIAQAVDQAIADLDYGTVLINIFTGFGYALGCAPWGSSPGQDIYDIQSGIGIVNNPFMFAHPVKSVVRGPFLQSPDVIGPDYSKLDQLGRKLAAFQADPGYGKLAGIAWTAMRG